MPIRHKDIFDDLPARLRLEVNPYVRELIEADRQSGLPAFYGPHLQGRKGRWLAHLSTVAAATGRPSPRSLVLEIGMHKGRNLTAMAAAHPELGFIGMDITFKRVVVTARKCQAHGLSNALTILGDARHCADLFAPAELQGIVAFFPDPWTKKASQGHNRLFTADFCANMAHLLAPGGFFWLKTDALSYFEETSSHLQAAGFQLQERPTGLCGESYESCFEAAFKAKNQVTYAGVWCLAGQKEPVAAN